MRGGQPSIFHTLVMREGSLEVKWQGASTREFSLWIGELFLLGRAISGSAIYGGHRTSVEAEDLSRSHPPFPLGGEVAAMWRTGIDWDVAVRDLWDVAVRDQAVRAGGGSRGVLMLPLYPPDGRLYLPSLYEPGGWEPRSGKRTE